MVIIQGKHVKFIPTTWAVTYLKHLFSFISTPHLEHLPVILLTFALHHHNPHCTWLRWLLMISAWSQPGQYRQPAVFPNRKITGTSIWFDGNTSYFAGPPSVKDTVSFSPTRNVTNNTILFLEVLSLRYILKIFAMYTSMHNRGIVIEQMAWEESHILQLIYNELAKLHILFVS